MASFALKTLIFLTFPFNPKFENVLLALYPQILYGKTIDTGVIICAKISFIGLIP